MKFSLSRGSAHCEMANENITIELLFSSPFILVHHDCVASRGPVRSSAEIQADNGGNPSWSRNERPPFARPRPPISTTRSIPTRFAPFVRHRRSRGVSKPPGKSDMRTKHPTSCGCCQLLFYGSSPDSQDASGARAASFLAAFTR